MSGRHRCARLRIRLVASGALGCVCAVGVFNVGSASADDGTSSTYELSAVATSLETLIQSGSLPVVGISGAAQAAVLGASAGLSSLGESVAEAGMPYSPLVSSLPGTVVGLVGPGVPSIPEIPGFVSSSYPGRPVDGASQAGYNITATSGSDSSEGRTGVGVESPGTGNQTLFAHAQTVLHDDRSVSAIGSTGIDLLNFGELFDIANVSTTASIDISKSGEIAYHGNNDLGTITFQKLPSGVEAGAIRLLGAGMPIPIKDNLATINSVLQPLGITVRVLDTDFLYANGSRTTGIAPDPARQLKSVVTAGLSVSITRDVPTQGVITVTEILGRTSVSATSRVFGGAGLGTDASTSAAATSTTASGADLTAVGSRTAPAVAQPRLPSLSTSDVDAVASSAAAVLPSLTSVSTGSRADQAAESRGERALGGADVKTVSSQLRPNSAEGPYLALALAGLFAALSALVVRPGLARLPGAKR